MQQVRVPKVEIQELGDDFIKFILYDTDLSVANALRRVMVAEVPTLAIDLVTIERNTSVMNDEFLSHRLGLVPIVSTKPMEEYIESQECECDSFCPNCAVTFTLEQRATGDEILTVTSQDLISDNESVVNPVHFSSLQEQMNSHDKGVMIMKLAHYQEVKLTAIAKKGIAKEHSKWSPVVAAAFQAEPIVNLNPVVMETLPFEKKEKFVKSCPATVFAFDENDEQIVVQDHMKCIQCDECVKTAASFKDDPEDDGLVEIGERDDKFHFSIETTGVLKPEVILETAINIILEKLKNLGHQCIEVENPNPSGSSW